MRMARVLGSSLRIKIMVALSVRPMSPKMIQAELDEEYEVSTIDKNLKVLEQDGWVELVDAKRGGPRRGATEHVYRAIRLPIFDDIIWPALPLAMREMVSWRIFESLIKRLKNARGARVLDARDDPHVTCTPGSVDQLGWDRIIAQVNSVFESFVGELPDAALRIADSGEQPIETVVALAFFESPRGRRDTVCHGNPAVEANVTFSNHSFTMRMAKTMADPLCRMILDELSTRTMSAKMFFDEFGGKPIRGFGGEPVAKNAVYRAFRKLKEFDWLEPVEMESQGRGRRGKEHFYRAVRPPIFDCGVWPVLPEAMENSSTGRALRAWFDQVGDAIRARTMDARINRHFTWTPGGLDRLGWERTTARADELREFVHDELRSAAVRLKQSGEQPIPMTVALAVVESAVASTRVEPGSPLI